MITTEMRYQGCMNGLAVGDAVGTTVEFRRPGTFSPVIDMTGGGLFNLKPGEWTDDTSMALCLATSLLRCKAFDPHDQMKRYLRWAEEGYLSSNGKCFDIGNTIQSSLQEFVRTKNSFAGSDDPYTAGNGSLMRLAPVPLYFASDPEQAIQLSGESSRTTHGACACIDACRYFAGLIVGAGIGTSKDELLSEHYTPVDGLWDHEPLCDIISMVAGGSFKGKEPPEIVGSGYVVQSLEAALWAFHKSSCFKEGCLLAVNLGNDADTTGAIYGQIAGAYYGVEDIPKPWRERIAQADHIAAIATALANASQLTR